MCVTSVPVSGRPALVPDGVSRSVEVNSVLSMFLLANLLPSNIYTVNRVLFMGSDEACDCGVEKGVMDAVLPWRAQSGCPPDECQQ